MLDRVLEYNISIGLTILELMRQRGISKEELHEMTGLDISSMVKGQHNFTIEDIVTLENALKHKIIMVHDYSELIV